MHQTRRSIEIRLEQAVTGASAHDDRSTPVLERPRVNATLEGPLETPVPTPATDLARSERLPSAF